VRDTDSSERTAATMAQGDFEVNEQGLYVATRQFLLRRGYCCGCGCRNCPYIGTAQDRYPGQRPLPATAAEQRAREQREG
jgi:hypothetical protein